jgi:hypothetical protein
MAEQSEKDRDIRGSNIVDPEKIEAYKEALRKLVDNNSDDTPPTRPADAARAELQAAQERVASGETRGPQEPPVQHRIGKRYRDIAERRLPEARDQLRNGPPPGEVDPGPPEAPDPRQ